MFGFAAPEERRAFIVSFARHLLAGESVADNMRGAGDRGTSSASRTGRTPTAVPVKSTFVRPRTLHFHTRVIVCADQVRILPASELRLAFVIPRTVDERAPVPVTCQTSTGAAAV